MLNRLKPLFWIALVVVVAIAAYLLVQHRTSTPQTGTAASTPTTATSSMTTLAAVVVSPERSGNFLRYAVGLQLFQLDLTKAGAAPTLMGTLDLRPDEVRWRPDGQRALALVESEPPHWVNVNVESGSTTDLPPAALEPEIARNRDRILYTYTDGSQTNVSIADTAGTNWQAVTPLSQYVDRWWWPGDGTVALGVAQQASPPQFVRLLVGEKRVEVIAPSHGDAVQPKLSPNESLALIDTGTDAAPTISTVAVAGGTITTPTANTTVARSAWLDDHTVLSVTTDGTIVSFDFQQRTQTKLGAWPQAAPVVDQLVAVTTKDFYIISTGSLLKIPRP